MEQKNSFDALDLQKYLKYSMKKTQLGGENKQIYDDKLSFYKNKLKYSGLQFNKLDNIFLHGGAIPENVTNNLTEINDLIKTIIDQREQMKQTQNELEDRISTITSNSGDEIKLLNDQVNELTKNRDELLTERDNDNKQLAEQLESIRDGLKILTGETKSS